MTFHVAWGDLFQWAVEPGCNRMPGGDNFDTRLGALIAARNNLLDHRDAVNRELKRVNAAIRRQNARRTIEEPEL